MRRVAVVGAGPSGAYAVGNLLRRPNIQVDVFDRLLTPGGLVRAGVAPDHAETKKVERQFDWWLSQPGVRLHLGIEIGRDISAAELAGLHDAVIYTCGASASRSLGIPGEDLPGSHAATDFVGWYNGHPDYAQLGFDLSAERAVVIGNGNVAFDVARILTVDVERLRCTDIADHALAALQSSAVREVVVLGRRGPADAAFTVPELLALCQLDNIEITVDIPDGLDAHKVPSDLGFSRGFAARRKLEVIRDIEARRSPGATRRIVLRFLGSPVAIVGDSTVQGVRVARNNLGYEAGATTAHATADVDLIEAGLVLRSVGYRGTELPGVPFDSVSGRIPNKDGRVINNGQVARGLYAAGWIKRGPSGVIGTNKRCADETVSAVLDDLTSGLLPAPPLDAADRLASLLASRRRHEVTMAGWRAIDAHERRQGAAQQRPRVKVCNHAEFAEIAARQE